MPYCSSRGRLETYLELWLCKNEMKRQGELFFLKYALFWIPFVCAIIGGGVFERIDALRLTNQRVYEWGYMVIGMIVGVPCVLIPIVFPLESERHVPISERYTTKANAYIWIIGFSSNFFWTHYFESVLRTCYNFYSVNLNGVPLNLYLITHSYFAFYHTLSNMALRRLWNSLSGKSAWIKRIAFWLFLIALTYVTAFFEAFTIQGFPHYKYPDTFTMLTYGSLFYALYFVVSYPMFLRLDEGEHERWSLSRTVIDACAASYLITLVLESWRLGLGPLYDNPPPASQLCPNANYGAVRHSQGPPPFIDHEHRD